jgi:hypothetical protein
MPGLTVSRQRIGRPHYLAAPCKDPPHPLRWSRIGGRCSRTNSCGRQDRFSACVRQIFKSVKSLASKAPRHKLTVAGVVSSSRTICRVAVPSTASSIMRACGRCRCSVVAARRRASGSARSFWLNRISIADNDSIHRLGIDAARVSRDQPLARMGQFSL